MARHLVRILVVIGALLGASLRAELAEPPFALGDPGGQGLDLERLEVRVAAHGPLALTELEMTFRNPQDRRIEGKLVCALPPGATVSRFAKEVDGKLVEGEVVERLRATRIYTDTLHTMQDPALLEQDQGNRFRARIFPIAPRASVRLLLAYTSLHPMAPDGQRRIAIPLRGMPKIGHFKLLAICRPLPGETVQLADAAGTMRPLAPKGRVTFAEEMEQKDFVPSEDVVLAFRPGAATPAAVRLVAGDFQVAMFRPTAAAAQAPAAPATVRVLVDSSASQAAGGAMRIKALARVLELLEETYPRAAFTLEAFDIDVAPLVSHPAGEKKAAAAAKALEERHFLGATDLERALKHAGDSARAAKGPELTVLVTDGIPTKGSKETGDLVRALGSWPASARLCVLVIGSVQDASVTGAVAEAGRGRVVTLPLNTTWETHARSAVEELARPGGADFQAYDEAAEWIEPRAFRDVVAGAELIAFSRRKAGASAAVGITAGKGTELRADAAPLEAAEFAPLLEREAYRAQLAMLEREENAMTDAAKRQESRRRRVEISTKHRVLCPLTSMLVLESESEFARYGLDRRALADVMVVGKNGIELVKRIGEAPKPDKPGRPEPPVANPAPPARVEQKAEPDALGDIDSLPGAAPAPGGPAADDGLPGEDSDAAPEPDAAPKPAPGAPAEAEAPDDRTSSLPAAPPPAPPRLAVARAEAPPPAPIQPALMAPPPPPPPIPPVSFKVKAISGQHPDFVAVIEFEGQEHIVQRGSKVPDGVNTQFEVKEITYEKVTVFDMKINRLVPRVLPMAEGETPLAPPTPIRPSPPTRAPQSSGSNHVPKLHTATWPRQAAEKPTAADLDALRAKVAGNPMDRAARNALAFALDRARDASLTEAAYAWQSSDPDNPMVYEFLGNAYARARDAVNTRRAYSSIAEVSPGESGLLNRAGFLMLKAEQPDTAAELFRFAIERRPEHANNDRGLALALWTAGRHEEAAKVLSDALGKDYHGRYGDLPRVLREELGAVLAAWLEAEPGAAARVKEIAERSKVDVDRRDALRISLHWETDASDVDLHIVDPPGEECYYSNRENASGVTLYQDLTRGLGPEVVTVPPGRLVKGAYHVGVKYFAAGPMGVSRGIVVIQSPAQKGKPALQIEPFCLLPDVREKDLRHVAVVEAAPR